MARGSQREIAEGRESQANEKTEQLGYYGTTQDSTHLFTEVLACLSSSVVGGLSVNRWILVVT